MPELIPQMATIGGPTVCVVIAFIYYLIRKDKSSADIAKTCHDSHERVSKMMADTVDANVNCINDCKLTIGETREVVREATKVLRRMNGNHLERR